MDEKPRHPFERWYDWPVYASTIPWLFFGSSGVFWIVWIPLVVVYMVVRLYQTSNWNFVWSLD